MATVTLTVEGADIGSVSISTSYSKEMSDRFVSYLVENFGVDENGEPRNLQEIVGVFWDGIKQGTHANIERHERQRAQIEAAAAVPPMESL